MKLSPPFGPGLPARTLAARTVHGATAMSEVRPRALSTPRRFPAPSTLARASLGLPLIVMSTLARAPLALPLIALSTTGCLITDPPQFTAPQHTAPFLLQATAEPDPNQILWVDDVNLPAEMTFSAQVVSQDDSSPSVGPFYQIETNLYIDYGYTGFPGEPFRYYFGGTTITAGTLETTGRTVNGSWDPGVYSVPYGCHTATLVVSHIFDQNQCPACSDDYSTITWQMIRCNSGMPGTDIDCTTLPTKGAMSCMGLTNSCAQVLADAGPDASACPEPADGGAGGGGS
jgi:hypothetical protein